jgi:hypothetical protein
MTTSLIKGARVVVIVALALTSMYSAPALSKASGACGFLLTMSYDFAYLYGNPPGPGFGLNALGTINFNTSTITINLILEDPAGSNSKQYPGTLTVPFTTSVGPFPGSSTITFMFSSTSPVFKVNLLPVGGGQTILMQWYSPTLGIDGSVTGRCEMF